MNTHMTVLSNIRDLIFPDLNDHLWIRGEHKKLIEDFMEKPALQTAQELYNFIQKVHKQDTMFSLMDDLKLYEETLMKILPEQRDHYIHSVNVYLMGLGIYNSCASIRRAVTIDTIDMDKDKQTSSFLFRWSLAACLHDLAYPLELTLKSFNKYSTKLHQKQSKDFSFVTIDSGLYKNFNVLPILKPKELSQFAKKDTALGLISNRLVNQFDNDENPYSVLSYQTLLKYIDDELENSLKNGKIDHGAFSAMVLLKRAHQLYQENSHWPIDEFYGDVVDASTAIFLHNFYRFTLLKEWFGNGVYRYDEPSPLGYLLFVSDSLCEWLRGKKTDPSNFSFHIIDDTLQYIAPATAKESIDKASKLFDKRIKINIYFETEVKTP